MKPKTQSPDKIADFNHLILYAKYWYQRGNVIEDVKKILAERCAIDQVSDSDMWSMMVMALIAYVPEHRLDDYLTKLFVPRQDEKTGLFVWFTDICPLERAVKNVLSELCFLSVQDDEGEILLNLGKPNPKILPLRKDLE